MALAVCAGIAQLVEHNLAKVGVASSSLVSRSILNKPRPHRRGFFMCPFNTERSVCRVVGLQSGFTKARWQSGDAAACKAAYPGSIPGLASNLSSPGGGTGRRKGLKIPRRKLRAGSIPAPGTNKIKDLASNLAKAFFFLFGVYSLCTQYKAF